jgi:hypothetical protein
MTSSLPSFPADFCPRLKIVIFPKEFLVMLPARLFGRGSKSTRRKKKKAIGTMKMAGMSRQSRQKNKAGMMKMSDPKITGEQMTKPMERRTIAEIDKAETQLAKSEYMNKKSIQV